MNEPISVDAHAEPGRLARGLDPYGPAVRRAPVTLHGRWLVAARLGVILFAILCVSSFIISIPQNWRYDIELRDIVGDAPSQAKIDEANSALRSLGLSPKSLAVMSATAGLTQVIGFMAVGVYLVRQKSNELMALLVAVFLFAMASAQFPPDLIAMQATHPIRAGVGFAIDLAFLLGFVNLFFLFPDGRFTPRWTIAISVAMLLSLVNDLLITHDAFKNPSPLKDALQFGTLIVSAVIAQIYRYRRTSGPVERQQIKWFLSGLGFALLAFVLLNVAIVDRNLLAPAAPAKEAIISELILSMVWVPLQLCIPLTLAIAIMRYRLFEIDVVINRALVFAGLTASIAGLYALVVVGFGNLLHTGDNLVLSLTATVIVALIFQPLRLRLQRGVNHLLYGDRDEPYTVLTRLGRRLEGTLAPNAVLTVIVDTVATALKLPYVAIARLQASNEQILAERGPAVAEPFRFQLIHQGETIGSLLVAPRGPNEPLTRADRELLNDIARQAGAAVHAVQLTIDLQQSRERLVLAREEERRRLRRDLHDGLGPRLAALTLRIETARERLANDPLADELLGDLSTRTEDAVADIRRLVYSLRPPALDDLGLVPALRQASESYGSAGPMFTLEAPDQLPALPAAVEVATYRIAQEAIANVVRHANARHCVIRLTVNAGCTLLLIEVEDDGRGLPPDKITGIGLHSMRERAEELGGSCEIQPREGGGTIVRARLPFQPIPSDDTPDERLMRRTG
ncbi:MAG TPA: GAF domain-containing sensor histidine kinase [Nitrolancea sp.]|nr:GAF domain-containing sensor histidine kinase [Nitrolancea sp.]